MTEFASDRRETPTSAESPRKPYAPPSLVCYGKVAALTQGGSCNTGNDSGTSTCSGPGTMNGIWPTSQRSLKTNIVRVGDHPDGYGLYLFEYKPEHQGAWGAGRHFGVMAEEVERVRPDAVRRNADGYKVVSYSRLGIEQCR